MRKEFKYTISGLNVIVDYLEQEIRIAKETIKHVNEENGFNKKQIRKHKKYLKDVEEYLRTALFVANNYREKLIKEEE